MRVLHVIHDYLPRHRAGSEIYAHALCRALRDQGTEVHVLCAEYDPSRAHATVSWREVDGIPVTEVVNNWDFQRFDETWRSRRLGLAVEHVLRAVRPDLLHVHNLLGLSCEIPTMAARVGIASVATLHDYTLLCPSGGQRVRPDEAHVCHDIVPTQCARCFTGSAFGRQMTASRIAGAPGGGAIAGLARRLQRRAPALFERTAKALATDRTSPQVAPEDIEERLSYIRRRVFEDVALFVAPSESLASEFVRFGIPRSKVRTADYGFAPLSPAHRSPCMGRLRIGFVGTLAWHKGVHVLIEAARRLPIAGFEVRIFGDTGTFPKYHGELVERSRGLPIEFLGAFDHADRGRIYAGIDLLVVPSLWYENSPLVIHEALQAGVPVVGSRIGGIPDLVRHGEWGLTYDAFSADSLAAALRMLIDDRDLLARFARALPAVRPLDDDARCWRTWYREAIEARA